MSIVRQMIKQTLAGVLPRKRFLVRGPVSCANADSPVEFALTFDDGPHPEWTPPVLDALADAGWKGTFFVIGRLAEQYPDLLRRIVDEGHTLGNHTFHHTPPSKTNAETFLDGIRRTDSLIKDLTGVRTRLVRPPLGKLNWDKLSGLWKTQHSVILWNVDPKDFNLRETSEAVAWADSYNPKTGDVVLLHDRLPYAAAIVDTLARRHGRSARSVTICSWLPRSYRARNVLEASV